VPGAPVIPPSTAVFALVAMVAISALLVAIGLRNPRVMLQDYPKDVQAAVPPKTVAERRETVWWGTALIVALFAPALAAAVAAQLQASDRSFAGGFLNALVVLLAFNLFDWLVLDWIMFCTVTPRFVVLPGTEGMAGYRDYGMHFRGFLLGLALSVAASAAIGGLTLLLPA
jgi:hypothetical protein